MGRRRSAAGCENKERIRARGGAPPTPAPPTEPTTPQTGPSSYHLYHNPEDIAAFRLHLLQWYDQHKRVLPWRSLAEEETDINVRIYAVWVSEVMLQQTQVATVINYYNKWMRRWPTVHALAAASLEEVNEMWAGLGYYSRGKRLHEGAQKMVSQLKGEMPRTAETLQRLLPGVGRYTAGAIASIALGQVTGAVDGNVIRVFCRMRAIGAESTSPTVSEVLWKTADTLVDAERPGDFNQALMELGALICTPKAPLCSQCPVQSLCHAYRKAGIKQEGKSLETPAHVADIEDCVSPETCCFCSSEPWDKQLGVMNFPRKTGKKAPRVERTLTFIVEREDEQGEKEYLFTRRPDKGLLAGMWEFPNMLLEEKSNEQEKKAELQAQVESKLGISLNTDLLCYVGEVVHVFSHIHQTYVVYGLRTAGTAWTAGINMWRWLTLTDIHQAAVSAAVKKIIKLYQTTDDKQQATNAGKRKNGPESKKGTQKKRSKKTHTVNGADQQQSLYKFFSVEVKKA